MGNKGEPAPRSKMAKLELQIKELQAIVLANNSATTDTPAAPGTATRSKTAIAPSLSPKGHHASEAGGGSSGGGGQRR